ncbi:hypothetical protein ACVWXN_007316 [Bradyrhizobium sp. i1.4.4]|uniref:hypothetical protein n=1 Tax=unclassified Bradyrhizobium TaxID=2631580 RepID=UPI003392AA5B
MASEEFAEKLQALEAEIEALTGAEQFDPGDIAIAGAFFCLDYHGEPRIERGFVRAEDWKAASVGKNAEPDSETRQTDQGKPLSEKLDFA